ncbi:MAG: D-alanine--D-alanine ligase A, partial [Roseiflexus castenholzii]
LAVQAFKAIDGAGLARVDFLLNRETGDLYLNEINTMPGFTPVSMYAMMWEASGLPYTQLLDRLIELALERRGRGRHA